MIFRLKQRLYEILEVSQSRDPLSLLFKFFMTALILLNVIAFIVTTVEVIKIQYGFYLKIFETISILIFTVEYLTRIWVCTLKKNLLPW